MNKRYWISLLIGVNLVLGAALLLVHLSPQPAFAQNGPDISNRYIAVAGEMQDELDVLYVLDSKERFLHAFIYDRAARQLLYTAARDLDRDFRNP